MQEVMYTGRVREMVERDARRREKRRERRRQKTRERMPR